MDFGFNYFGYKDTVLQVMIFTFIPSSLHFNCIFALFGVSRSFSYPAGGAEEAELERL